MQVLASVTASAGMPTSTPAWPTVVRPVRIGSWEDEMTNARGSVRDTREMVAQLDRREEQANHLKVPVAYASMQYMLRNHIDLVREGLRKHADKAAAE